MFEEGTPEAGVNRYKSGPWLIVYGHGLVAEARARDIARQCAERGVDYEISTIDEINPNKGLLRPFPGFVVVLPSVAGRQRVSAVRRVDEFVKAYRAIRNDGLTPLLDGSRRWFQVGVIQLVGDERAMDRELRSITHIVDCHHRLREGDAVDPFAAYTSDGRLAPPDAQFDQPTFTRGLGTLRANLHSWGIGWEVAEVTKVRQFIDSTRDIWESPTFSDLHRPVRGSERNRLDFLLDDPAYVPPATECSRKKWMEGGQRVVSRVLHELREHYPDIRRPAERAGAKNLQQDFQFLYQGLHAAEEVLRREDPRIS